MERHLRSRGRWQGRVLTRSLLRQIARRIARLDRQGVHGFGVGIKLTRRRWTGAMAIVAYVEDKRQVARHMRVPRRIWIRNNGTGRRQRIPTDFVVAPRKAEACTIGPGRYLRANDAATCSVTWRSDRSYLISVAHCFFRPSDPNDPNNGIGVEIYDSASGTHKRVGWVDKWSGINATGINLKDDARAALNAGIEVEHLTVNGERILRTRNFAVGSNERFFFVTETGEHPCHRPVAGIPGNPLHVSLATPDGTVIAKYESYFRLTMIDDTVEPGNSGAALFHRATTGLEWVGVLFGRQGPGIALAFSAPSIAARHGVPLL